MTTIEQLLETYITLDSAREEILQAVNVIQSRASEAEMHQAFAEKETCAQLKKIELYEREIHRLNSRDIEKSQALQNKIEDAARLSRENKHLRTLVGTLGALSDELFADREELREKLDTEQVLCHAAILNFDGMKEERDEATRRRDLAELGADTWKSYAKHVRWQRNDWIREAEQCDELQFRFRDKLQQVRRFCADVIDSFQDHTGDMLKIVRMIDEANED